MHQKCAKNGISGKRRGVSAFFFSARRLCCGPCAQEGANEHIGAASAVERQFQETAPAAELLPINYRSWQMDFVKKDT